MKNDGRKKRPADYPQFAFRVPLEVKDELSVLIDEVRKLYNAGLDSDEKVFTKNRIIIEALRRGLKTMKKSKSGRSSK